MALHQGVSLEAEETKTVIKDFSIEFATVHGSGTQNMIYLGVAGSLLGIDLQEVRQAISKQHPGACKVGTRGAPSLQGSTDVD